MLITDDEEIREINREWLGRDRPTDVIAFSQLEGEPFPTSFIGDVVISAETAARQAEEIGHSFDREICRLMAHGVLHLLGHDHVHGGKQAAKMKKTEDMLVDLLQETET